MKQSIINKAIDEWRSRLAACVRAKGDILNICFVEHEHYFFACLTVRLRNFINVAEIAKTTLSCPTNSNFVFYKVVLRYYLGEVSFCDKLIQDNVRQIL